MPVKIVHSNHVEIMGFGCVLITSPSATADLDVGQIAEEAALTARAFAVIGKPTRDSAEPGSGQSADHGLRAAIEEFLVEDGVKYILEIWGKIEPGIEVGMMRGKTCSDSTLELVKSRLEKEFTVTLNDKQGEGPPNSLTDIYSRKDEKGKFLVETVRVSFGGEERQFSKEKVISVIAEIADLLNGRVGSSLAD